MYGDNRGSNQKAESPQNEYDVTEDDENFNGLRFPMVDSFKHY